MSYSITVTAVRKGAAKALVALELGKVATSQPSHERDLLQAQAAANAFIDTLADDPEKDVKVSMGGWLSGDWQGNDLANVNGAHVTITASLVPREA